MLKNQQLLMPLIEAGIHQACDGRRGVSTFEANPNASLASRGLQMLTGAVSLDSGCPWPGFWPGFWPEPWADEVEPV